MIEKYGDIGVAYTAFDEPINLKKINKLFNKKIETEETFTDSTGLDQVKIIKTPYISETDKTEIIKEIIQDLVNKYKLNIVIDMYGVKTYNLTCEDKTFRLLCERIRLLVGENYEFPFEQEFKTIG